MAAPAPTILDLAMSVTCLKAMVITSRTPAIAISRSCLPSIMAIYQSVSITAWMASTPDLLLATNFKVPESTFTAFPKGKEVMPD